MCTVGGSFGLAEGSILTSTWFCGVGPGVVFDLGILGLGVTAEGVPKGSRCGVGAGVELKLIAELGIGGCLGEAKD